VDAVHAARRSTKSGDRGPAPFVSRGGAVPQPNPAAKANFVFPEAMREIGASMFAMSDAEIAAALDHAEPPVG
jgi:hypothetical protein